MKYRLFFGALLLPALAFVLWLWWRDGQPVAVPDAPEARLDCVSYSPAERTGDLDAVIPPEVVARDLKLLSERFRCVRIYTVSEGLDAALPAARELGLKVLMGLWIGRESARNQQEIRQGLQLAEEYRDVIEAVIVGNEVLLRRELSPGRLAELIAQVDEGTDLPVTYADVWDFWEENPTLAPLVNFVTIHLLPYWEDDPTGIEEAIAHVAQVYEDAHAAFPDKPILIGEVGWPSRGRQREDAAPGLVNQARFLREFVAWAHDAGVKYNLIEAFDQPWKRNQEGTVGGYWGQFDAAGRAKFPLTGPIVEDEHWRRGFHGAAAGAVLFLLAGLATPRRRHPGGLLILLLAGGLAGAVAMLQWRYFAAANRSSTEWIATVVLALMSWGIYLRLIATVARREVGTLPVPAGLAELLGTLGGGSGKLRGRERVLGLLRFGLLLALAWHLLGLAFDPRYRDFPLSMFALPVVALLLLSLMTPPARRTNLRLLAEEAVLALIIVGCAVTSVVREGLMNGPALAFAALSGAAAFSVFWSARGFAGDDQRGEQHAVHG